MDSKQKKFLWQVAAVAFVYSLCYGFIEDFLGKDENTPLATGLLYSACVGLAIALVWTAIDRLIRRRRTNP